jgi:hypothetical protein
MTVKCNLFKQTGKWYGEVTFETDAEPWQISEEAVLKKCGKEYTNIENFFIYVESKEIGMNFLIVPVKNI